MCTDLVVWKTLFLTLHQIEHGQYLAREPDNSKAMVPSDRLPVRFPFRGKTTMRLPMQAKYSS